VAVITVLIAVEFFLLPVGNSFETEVVMYSDVITVIILCGME
jgi:hypothetical protein